MSWFPTRSVLFFVCSVVALSLIIFSFLFFACAVAFIAFFYGWPLSELPFFLSEGWQHNAKKKQVNIFASCTLLLKHRCDSVTFAKAFLIYCVQLTFCHAHIKCMYMRIFVQVPNLFPFPEIELCYSVKLIPNIYSLAHSLCAVRSYFFLLAAMWVAYSPNKLHLFSL